MSTFLTILLIIGCIIGGIIVLGVLGWIIQAIAAFIGLSLDGITGCIGCFLHFIWHIIAAVILISIFVALV